MESLLLHLSILMAVFFAFLNGYHDGSNVVATSILSRSVSPWKALLLASLAELAGAVLLGGAVVRAVSAWVGTALLGAGVQVGSAVLFSAIGGMIVWSPMAWWVGFPPSSSHALIGGLVGAALAGTGFGTIDWGLFLRFILLLLAAPAAGIVGGLGLAFLLKPGKRRQEGVPGRYASGRIAGLLLIGLCHGANNAQKGMALVVMALFFLGDVGGFELPLWVSLVCGSSIALGVYFGGWNIVGILGNRIFSIRPLQSLLSQTLSGAILLVSTLSGGPVNGVEVIKATVAGLGGGKRTGSVYRNLSRDILLAMAVTMPSSALLSAAIYWILSGATGIGIGNR